MFERELSYFIANQEELVREYEGQTLVLRGEKVVSAHPSTLEAYLEAKKKYEPGTFMIQPCVKGTDAYTVTITSHELFGNA